MSSMSLPGQLPSGSPPANTPGDPRVRAPADRQQISLDIVMGQAYKTLGEALLKGPQKDPMEVAKGIGMVQQALSIVPRPGMGAPPQSGVDMTPQTGIARPVDRMVDATTGAMPQGTTPRP